MIAVSDNDMFSTDIFKIDDTPPEKSHSEPFAKDKEHKYATAFSPDFKYTSTILLADLKYIYLSNLELNTEIKICEYANILGQPMFSNDSRLVFFDMRTGITDVYRTKDGSKLFSLSRKRFRTIESTASGNFRTVIGIYDFLTNRVHKLNIKDFIHF
jgi:hypothetical protein